MLIRAMKFSSLLYSQGGHARAWPTLFIAIAMTALVTIRVQDGFLAYKSNEVLALVVPLAGTIVALALPAAQLAQTVMESFLSTGNDLVKSRRPLGDVANFLVGKVQERRRDLEAMKCVVLYGLASLLVGLCGVFGLFADVQFGEHIAVRDFIATLSAALLVASVLWFVPVVRSSFNFDRAEAFAAALREAAKAEPVSSTSKEIMPPDAPAEDSKGSSKAG